VYAAFDERDAARGWEERRDALHDSLARVRRPRDLAALPLNDLARSSLTEELIALGAFRADVSGAGPTVYGLFHHKTAAESAKRALKRPDGTWITSPAWYG
jgi:4-diphosphocytidyl-2C-methyl-D-erythritol kinase